MSSTFGDSTMGLTYRRVQVVGVNEDGTEVQVADSTGWRTHLDGTVRPKGTALPTEGEVWLIERLDATHWILRAQIASAEADLGSEVNAIIAAQVEQALAEQAAEAAQRAAIEAALAAGITSGDAVILIQDSPPGPEHQSADTLWINTTNGLNRPMRWDGQQWIVVVDWGAMEAARAAVEARDAAAAAAAAAGAAQQTADAAKDTADAAVQAAEDALAAAAGKGRIIYGDPLETPGEDNSLLIGPGNRLYRWDGEAWVEAPDQMLYDLADELDVLTLQIDANITDLSEVQAELVGVIGQIDGKSTIWPVGSSPDLGVDDTGDLRLLVDGGVEYWDGYEWLPADPRVAAAVNEAAEALGLANTKSTTYYKATEPVNAQRPDGDIEAPETEFSTNDLWLRTGDNRLHRWDGEAWLEVRDTSILLLEGLVTDLGDELTGLEGKVDGKSTIYIQDTAPDDVYGTEDIGDLWIDTAGGGRVYKVWDGEEWVLSDDPRVAEVLDTINTKITTYYGPTEPTGTVQEPLVTGDLWLRSPDNRTFRFDGENWVDVGDTRIGDHENRLSLVQDALVEMDGKIDGKAVVWFQPVDPSLNASPSWDIAQMGDIWIDTSVPGQTTYKVWDSNSWEVITDPAALAALERVDSRMVTYFANGTTGPEGPNFPPPEGYVVGDLWIRTSDKMIFRWDGTSWVDATFIDARVGTQETTIANLQGDLAGLSGRIDGKATIYYQPSAPTGLGAEDKGDIWIDSDADPKTFQSWSGGGWIDITDQTALDALAGLDSKVTTYFASGTTGPEGDVGPFTVGDLWVHSSTKVLRRFDGENWVDITDPRLTNATAAIGVLQSDLSALDGKVDGRAVVYYQDTDPKNLPTTWGSDETGDIWINTSGATTVYNVWTGAAWRVITDPVATQALSTVQTKTTTYYKATKPIASDIQAPETAFRLGDLWIRTTDNRLHRYNGTDFLEVSDTRIGDQAAAIAVLQTDLGNISTEVDGKAVIWFQPSAPTGLVAADAGDIWIDSDAVPRTFKSWSGSEWVDITDQTALDALAGLDSKITTYYATEKAGPQPDLAFVNMPPDGFTEGDLWVNSSKGNAIYRYPGSGTAWALLALGKEAISADARELGATITTASASAPTNPYEGDVWIDISAGNVMKVYTSGVWVAYQDVAIGKKVTYQVISDGASLPALPTLTDRSLGDLHRVIGNPSGDILRELIVTPGPAWTDVKFGDSMLSSLSVGKLTGGTITADIALASGGTLTVGQTTENHVFIGDGALTSYRIGQGGIPFKTVEIGGGNDAFQVYDNAGDFLGGIKSDASMKTPVIDADLVRIQGTDVFDILSPMPQGVVVYSGVIPTQYGPYANTTGVWEFGFDAGADRRYEITITYEASTDGHNSHNIGLKKTQADLGTNPAAPRYNSPTFGLTRRMYNDARSAFRPHQWTWYFQPARDESTRWLWWVQPFNSTGIEVRNFTITVVDLGLHPNNPGRASLGGATGTPPIETAPKQDYVKEFSFATHQVWTQYGRGDSYAPQWVRAGTISGVNSIYRTYLPFPSELLSIISNLESASDLTRMQVRLSQTSGYHAYPWIGLISTTAVSGTTEPSRYRVEQIGTWFTLGDTLYFNLSAYQVAGIAAGTYKGISVGTSSSSVILQDFYGTGASSSVRPKVKAYYSA